MCSKKVYFLFFLLVGISIHALTNGFSVDGDGDEYLSYTRALAHHHSVFLQRDDLHSPTLVSRFDDLQKNLDPGENWKHLHLVRTRFGQILMLHFFFYSFLGWPIYSLLESLHLPVEATFSVLNLILILILMAYLNFPTYAHDASKFALPNIVDLNALQSNTTGRWRHVHT